MRIYVAGPYGKHNLPTEIRFQNTMKAIEAARQLIQLGHTPFVPHLCHFVHEGWTESPSPTTWRRMDLEWLQCCEAIVMIGEWYCSPGSLREFQEAERLGLTIYNTVEAVPRNESRSPSSIQE